MELRAVRRTTAEIEEERQLHYVAMTRAKHDLHLVVPQRSFMHQQSAQDDRHVYASRTRFLLNSILNLFGVGTWPVASAQVAARVPGQGVRVDLSARTRGMWW
jgi:DNA helicase-2/ATP-dependent DNA helicase PcrA